MERASFEGMFGPVPQLPFIGLYALRVASLERCKELLDRTDLNPAKHGNGLFVRFPKALGLGAWLFVEHEKGLPWRAR